jgi:hypothetical protein
MVHIRGVAGQEGCDVLAAGSQTVLQQRGKKRPGLELIADADDLPAQAADIAGVSATLRQVSGLLRERGEQQAGIFRLQALQDRDGAG